jgi:hypothetical protein
VTSASELCADPLLHPVKIVPAISDGGEANLATAAAFMGRPGYTIPLTLALVYAATHREELERTCDGNQIFIGALGDLFGAVAEQSARARLPVEPRVVCSSAAQNHGSGKAAHMNSGLRPFAQLIEKVE